jgi:hypothetical protein
MTDDPVAESLLACFERCQNYPRDLAGVQAMAKALEEAAEKQGVPMAAIVDRCRLAGPFCPTDFDLMATASLIRDEADRAVADRQSSEEKLQASERRLADMVARGLLAPRCELCEPGDPYCEYGGYKKHAREKAQSDRWAAQQREALEQAPRILSPPPIPDRAHILKQITAEDLQRAVEELRTKQSGGA